MKKNLPAYSSSMPNEMALLQQAVGWHQQGNLAEAERGYRGILAINPRNFNALGFLGTVYLQRGDAAQALTLLDRSIALNARQPLAHCNRGHALQQLNQQEDALRSFDLALKAQPDFVDACFGRAVALQTLGRADAAFDAYRKVVAFNPRHLDAHIRMGNVLLGGRRFEEAFKAYQSALVLAPQSAGLHCNLGLVCQRMGRIEESIAAYEKAVALQPDFAEAFVNLGNALRELERFDEALASYDKAIALKANYIDAYNNRGNLLRDVRRFDEALACFDLILEKEPGFAGAYGNRASIFQTLGRFDEALIGYAGAIALNPGFVEAYSNRGVLMMNFRQLDDAARDFEKAHAADPHYPEAYWNRSFLELLHGRFETGWPLYEYRWQSMQKRSRRSFTQPMWSGKESLENKTILVYVEQGMGDTLQFCRYASLLVARGARVVLEVQQPLLELVRTLPASVEVVVHGDELPAFDYQCPMMSLPLVCGTTVETIPADIPYLRVNADKQDAWRARLGERVRPRIGIVWSGNAAQGNDHNRSMPLAHLTPLLDLPVDLFVLQKDIRPADRLFLNAHPQIKTYQDEFENFSDTAAFVAEMDLVLSVCTSVAHLAGALSKPLWVMLCFAADFRWLLDREDSPWYPTARLFRQPAYGEWNCLVIEVALALREHFDICEEDHADAIVKLQQSTQDARDRHSINTGMTQALAFVGRAQALAKAGRFEEALLAADGLCALKPDLFDGHFNRAVALEKLERIDEAKLAYRKAIALFPGSAAAHTCLGNMHFERGELQDALACYNEVVVLEPDSAGPETNRGLALYNLGLLEDALASCDRTIALKPDYHEIHNNRGIVLKDLQRLDEAQASYDEALRLQPDYIDPKWNLSLLHLLRGDFAAGWPPYEWRWQRDTHKHLLRDLGKPRWTGAESLQGKTILLHPEQGLGDVIQFSRYVPMVTGLGAKVILELPPQLLKLMQTLEGSPVLVAHGAPLPLYNFHCPLMSLPLVLGTTLDTVPAEPAYLFCEPQRIKEWATRLGGRRTLRAGLVWSGNPRHNNDHNRSLTFDTLAPLLDMPIEWHCLQKEIRPTDRDALVRYPTVQTWESELEDFIDTAALIMQMDVVVTVDTSVAHLAGALGKPVWILLPYAPDYRWLLERDDSPWYPSARLFRQHAIGDWSGVLADLANALRDFRVQ
jgi:tetratricopeptide (TPR) repeat protein